jgi:hypothetical protein
MKTDISHSLRTSQVTSSPIRQAGAPTLQRTGSTGAVQQVGSASRIDTMLATRGAKTLERILTQYGGGVRQTSTAPKSADPFQRLSDLTAQVNDLFDKNPSVIEQVRGDKHLSTSIKRIASGMSQRLPWVSPEVGRVFDGFMAMAARLNPIEPKPILP